MNINKQYWDIRAQKTVKYKGEEFYTITPIPYYYARRKILFCMLNDFLNELNADYILDLGCGDGEYIWHLCNGVRKFHGVDISAEMIRTASEACDKKYVSFEVSGDGVHMRSDFDAAYIISVLAHVNDDTAQRLVESAYQSLKIGGGVCIFEQIAPYRIDGKTYTRRTCKEYLDMLQKHNFKILEDRCVRVDFTLHRQLFERRIAKLFYAKYAKQSDNYRIECNNNMLFRFLSEVFVILSPKRIYNLLNGWGYCFICALKN